MATNGKINVLQLVEGMSWGGAESKLAELISHMDRERFNTIVCSLGMGDRIQGRFETLGIPCINLTRRRRLDPKLVLDVAKLIRREKIDVVMTTLFYADVVGALASAISPNKAVFSWETISAPEWLLRRRLLAYRFAMRFCDKVISVSRATARWLVEKRGLREEKVTVIPYGVNLQLFLPERNLELRKQLGLPETSLVVGTVARLHPQKGHRYLIEAAGTIVARFPQARFVFVGDGDLRAELEAQVRARNLGENVLFLGFRSDVKDLLRTFDVFVLPSLYEGLPNVVLEAMATALPVVATSVDGTIELVQDGETGFLVPPEDPNALADKIGLLLSDEALRNEMGRKGRARVEREYSLEKQVSSFQELYEQYVNSRTSHP
ncbi:MAG: glycosyltransferase [Calditrichaeota bacterium]|nr:MAG: glycosyltransferase [Calditrichota bacterium]